jgi:hypothetical protein
MARLNSLPKKFERKANSSKDGLARAKARLILLTLLARLKPCRCYKAAWLSFSASCNAAPLLQNMRRLEFSVGCEVVLFQ